MTSVFEVLAEPRRRRILDLVRGGERSVGELAAELAASQPSVSKHLRVLREAGLVEVRIDEQRRLYRLRSAPLLELDNWLAPYRGAWTESLDRLEPRRLAGDPATPDTYSTGVLSHEQPTELKRLQALEGMSDAWTQRVLAERGLRSDWRCLELGTGAGSIARWLSAQCVYGKVVALDIDTRFLDAGWAHNLDVVQGDLRDVEFPPASFDLIHARALMMHLPNPEEVIAKAARWLAPGGWLVLEDPVSFATDSSPHPAWQRILRALEDALAVQGSDTTWARRRQPAILAEAGLTELGINLQPMITGDGGAVDAFMRIFFEQIGPDLISQKRVTADELAEGLALLDDPRFRDIAHCYLVAWGRRPAELSPGPGVTGRR